MSPALLDTCSTPALVANEIADGCRRPERTALELADDGGAEIARSARDEDTTSQQENLMANRAGDRRSTAPPSPLPQDIALAYRVNDAVKISGLSRSSIYKLIAEGELRSILVAGRRLIPADALRSLLGVT
jgi:hypothetical protein